MSVRRFSPRSSRNSHLHLGLDIDDSVQQISHVRCTILVVPVHLFAIESEVPGSPTSVRPTWNAVRASLQSAQTLGQAMFIDAATKNDLLAATEAFRSWTTQVASDEPIILWISIHGADPESGVPDSERKLVGTSGASVKREEIGWDELFLPVKGAHLPDRVVLLMDVCWGSSPTAPARLTTPAILRPRAVFGPTRNAFPNELSSASQTVIGWIAQRGLPSPEDAKAIVDLLNMKYLPSPTTGTGWYRAWWWESDGIVAYPVAGAQSEIKRK